MAKVKSAFFCQNCGTQYSKWMGQCTQCKEWNTISEEIIESDKNKAQWKTSSVSTKNKYYKINEIPTLTEDRISTKNEELDRVLGGGLVLGSVVLMGGEPGIGKSTLMLQMALGLKEIKTLYVSGEESLNQIKLRAQRMPHDGSNCHILTETNTQPIFQQAQELGAQLLIIDSIQTLKSAYIESSPGSISQIRECTAELIQYAKETNTPVILIGHINKEGNLAGPKILEHMVDVVLQFEGDRNNMYRLLRAHKNRYGATSELGIYEMQSTGLREVKNPSELLITKKDVPLSGNAIGVSMEGARPMMLEIQALVSTAVYGTPQRSSTGFDTKRLNMLLAVLEKRAGFHLGAKDVFINVTGGIQVNDPAMDLAVAAAILSSNFDVPLPDHVCFAGEIGLSGEIRAVQRVELRMMEAEKLGYRKIFLSKYNKLPTKTKSEIVACSSIEEVLKQLFQ